MLYISLLVMNRLNITEFAIFISLKYFLLPKDLTNQKIFMVHLDFRKKHSSLIFNVLQYTCMHNNG